MMPHHHPADELLLDFATGALAHVPRLVISGHLGSCPACRSIVAEAEAVGGALLEASPLASMHPDALAWALARTERPTPAPTAAFASPPDWITVPNEVLRAAMRRRWAAPGVWVASVANGPGRARGYLLGVAAGMSVPRHTHRGSEMVCVLKGSYRDGEALHGPGDFALNDETVDHRPVITADSDCVCIVAAEDALIPLDWVGRLFQPIVGI